MVKASSINPKYTITVGLCVSSALTALSGGLLAQYQKSCDINLGTGMVTIALASLIIGETLVGKRNDVSQDLGRDLWQLSVSFYRSSSDPCQCAGRMFKAGICIDSSCSDRISVSEEKNAVFAKQKYSKERIRQRKRGCLLMLQIEHVSKTFNPGTINEKKH